jgi:hypothetical protein
MIQTWGDGVMQTQLAYQSADDSANLISPLQLNFVVIKPQVACTLNAKWHSRLPDIHWSNVVRNKHQICFGAMYSQEYVASAIWSSPVARSFDYRQVLELRRLAISDVCPKNTATRMLGFMQRYIKKNMPQISLLISYQDTQVHTGTIYKAANWSPVHKTKYKAWDLSRTRNTAQSESDKVRWELRLQPNLEYTESIKYKQIQLGDI